MNTQQSANSVALSKIQAEAGARNNLLPGTYDIDTTVHVTGQIKVGADYTTAPTVSIPLKETLALFIAYCGVTREYAIAALRNAMVHAISEDGQGKGELDATMPIVAETMARVEQDIIAQLPRQNRKGVVTTRLTVEQLAEVVA